MKFCTSLPPPVASNVIAIFLLWDEHNLNQSCAFGGWGLSVCSNNRWGEVFYFFPNYGISNYYLLIQFCYLKHCHVKHKHSKIIFKRIIVHISLNVFGRLFYPKQLTCSYGMLHSLVIKPMTLTLLVTALLFKLTFISPKGWCQPRHALISFAVLSLNNPI